MKEMPVLSLEGVTKTHRSNGATVAAFGCTFDHLAVCHDVPEGSCW